MPPLRRRSARAARMAAARATLPPLFAFASGMWMLRCALFWKHLPAGRMSEAAKEQALLGAQRTNRLPACSNLSTRLRRRATDRSSFSAAMASRLPHLFKACSSTWLAAPHQRSARTTVMPYPPPPHNARTCRRTYSLMGVQCGFFGFGFSLKGNTASAACISGEGGRIAAARRTSKHAVRQQVLLLCRALWYQAQVFLRLLEIVVSYSAARRRVRCACPPCTWRTR